MSDSMREDALFLGIEIGGTKLQLGLGRGDGRLVALERRRVVPSDGSEGVRSQIRSAIETLLNRVARGKGRVEIAAVGIGFGGPVDARRGIVSKSFQVAGWDGFPLADWVRKTIGVSRVSLHNDADTAGLAEARFGAGIGFSPVLYVTIGSGIGGGLILDGQIYRGNGSGALEIGHLWVIDRTDSDLGVMTLEQVASGWAIAASARAYAERVIAEGGGRDWAVLVHAGGNPEEISAKHVADASRQGDLEARLLIDKAVTAVAHGLSQAVTLLAPHRIILGGGVSLIEEDLWLNPIRQKLDACVYPPFRGTFDLVTAALGEEVVVQGAISLARDTMA
jgi:glucokinase